jgi:hypothetical protein
VKYEKNTDMNGTCILVEGSIIVEFHPASSGLGNDSPDTRTVFCYFVRGCYSLLFCFFCKDRRLRESMTRNDAAQNYCGRNDLVSVVKPTGVKL